MKTRRMGAVRYFSHAKRWLVVLFFTLAATGLIWANLIWDKEQAYAFDFSTKVDAPTVSLKDYVMGQAEAAGLDKYKVYDLITCENRTWNTQAKFINKGGVAGVDRGLWQINDKYHSEVSNLCAYDYKCATREGLRILKQRGFGEWTCGKNLGK